MLHCKFSANHEFLQCTCPAAPGTCPDGTSCTEISQPSGSPCAMILRPLCIVDGELEAYHPHAACSTQSYPTMIKGLHCPPKAKLRREVTSHAITVSKTIWGRGRGLADMWHVGRIVEERLT
eukprot:4806283-Amphidinium_carterae.2